MLTKGKVKAGAHEYAYGFTDGRTHDGTRWFGHGGGAPGMNGDLRIVPSAGYIVVVLSNLDPPAGQDLALFALDRLPVQ
jgi:hypothetical protein